MAFKTERRCKICSSLLRGEIDKLISEDTPYDKIVDFAKNRGLDIAKHNISKHKSKHMRVDPHEIEAKIEETRQQEKVAKNVEETKIETIVSNARVLDDIIQKAYAGMADNTLKPTIDHALKAIELQARLKENHNLESQMLEFMMEFTKEPQTCGKSTIKLVNTVERVQGVVNGLEDFSGAKIRRGVEAIRMAETDDYRPQQNMKRVEATEEKQKPTVDTNLGVIKKTIVQTSLFSGIIPETEFEEQ